MTATGDVSDYDAATKDSLVANMAATLGVPEEDVSLSVTAASVRLVFSVAVADDAEADAVSEQAEVSLATAADATSTLGVDVSDTPVTSVVETRVTPPLALPPPSPPLPPPGATSPSPLPPPSPPLSLVEAGDDAQSTGGDDDTTVVAASVPSAVALVCIVLMCVACRRSKWTRGQRELSVSGPTPRHTLVPSLVASPESSKSHGQTATSLKEEEAPQIGHDAQDEIGEQTATRV